MCVCERERLREREREQCGGKRVNDSAGAIEYWQGRDKLPRVLEVCGRSNYGRTPKN